MAFDDGFDSHRYGIWLSMNLATISLRDIHVIPAISRSEQVNIPCPLAPQWYGYRNGGWQFIRAINVGMDNYDKASIDAAVRDKYVGEARLFSGWFYADKVSKFGDAPWVDHELTTESEELYAPRTPREEVMANVLADLTFATRKAYLMIGEMVVDQVD